MIKVKNLAVLILMIMLVSCSSMKRIKTINGFAEIDTHKQLIFENSKASIHLPYSDIIKVREVNDLLNSKGDLTFDTLTFPLELTPNDSFSTDMIELFLVFHPIVLKGLQEGRVSVYDKRYDQFLSYYFYQKAKDKLGGHTDVYYFPDKEEFFHIRVSFGE